MVYENLHLVENLLMEIVSESKKKDEDNDINCKDKIELLDKEEELGKIDLESDLKSTGNKKRDFYKKLVEIVNDVQLGKATLLDLVQYVKKRKKREPKIENS